ncbi:uncharacterized protein LOC135207862 [Macrobrachium nipponense]|uniref:uncharacterized protein LOC135207862 n=1 Tax=Macrobrachium nipponense TaxID=159736 RepID=UPI0030C7E030
MLSLKLCKSERTLHMVISNTYFYYHHLLSGIHTSIPRIVESSNSHCDSSNGKLDVFVKGIKLRNKRTKVLSDHQPSVRSRKLLKGRPEVSKIKLLTVGSIESSGNTRTNTQTKVWDSGTARDRPSLEPPSGKIELNVCTDENFVKRDISRKDGVGNLNQENIKPDDSKFSITSTKSEITQRTHFLEDKTTGQVQKSAVKVSDKPWKIRVEEQLMLTQLISSGRVVEALSQIEDYKKQNRVVPFRLFRYFCGCACTQGLVNEIYRVKEVAEKIHPLLYKKHLCFDNYLASAYCYCGDFSRSLEQLLSLYHETPKGAKKLKDAVSLITINILKSNEEENEQMVLKFAEDLATTKGILYPALSVWRFCFCSSLYRHQMIAKYLLESFPELSELLPQKLEPIISKSYIEANLDLLHRTFQLLLQHEFTQFYASATSALLYHQCEMGDVAGVNQTLKFALMLKVYLKPSQIQRFLSLLAYRSKPAPMLLLDMKYKFPPRPLPHHTPEFQYKF